MGRVTIFSLPSCPHCKKAKGLLSNYGVEYYDISLGAYPEKRSDMLKLTDRLTVPQIFLDDEHIGGAADVEDLHQSGKLKGLLEALSATAGPTEPMLARPDYEPKAEEDITVKEELLCIGAECVLYNTLVDSLTQHLPIKDHSYHLKKYKNCFLGTELVDHLVNHYKIATREEAVQVSVVTTCIHARTHTMLHGTPSGYPPPRCPISIWPHVVRLMHLHGSGHITPQILMLLLMACSFVCGRAGRYHAGRVARV